LLSREWIAGFSAVELRREHQQRSCQRATAGAEVPGPAGRFTQIAFGVQGLSNQALAYPFAQAALSSFYFDVQEEGMTDCFMSADDIHDAESAKQCHLVVTASSSRTPVTMDAAR
jgi:hypothetical protein